MGIFSDIFQGEGSPSSFNNEESLLGLVIAIVAADGEIDDDEFRDVQSLVSKSRTFANSSQNFSEIVDKVFKVLKRDGVDHLVDLSINGLNDDIKEPLFITLVDLAYSDGSIAKSEEKILERIQNELKIDQKKAIEYVKLMTLKNSI